MYRRRFWDFDYACRKNGQRPAKKYYDSLSHKEKTNVKASVNKLGDEGRLAQNRFKKLQGCDIWQLTIYELRFLCFKQGRNILFTNGFLKPEKETPKRYIDEAKRIMKEHLRKQ